MWPNGPIPRISRHQPKEKMAQHNGGVPPIKGKSTMPLSQHNLELKIRGPTMTKRWVLSLHIPPLLH